MKTFVLLPWIALAALFGPAATDSPETTCGSNHTKLLLLVDVRHDTNLTVARLKHIIPYFMTKVKDKLIKKLDVCLVDPSQKKTLFNLTNLNSSKEIMSVIDQLLELNVSIDDSDVLLEEKTQLSMAFEFSVKVIANEISDFNKLVVVILSSCQGSCEDLFQIDFKLFRNSNNLEIITLLEVPTKTDPKMYTENYVYYYREKGLDLVFIDSRDDFHMYNPVTLDLCRVCPEDWIQNPWSGNWISCYFIMTLDTPISWSNAFGLCESLKSSLLVIETEDELNFIIDHLQRNKIFKKADLNMSETTDTVVFNIGLLKSFRFKHEHYMWSNLRPFNLDVSFESNDDSRERCVALSISFNAWNLKDEIRWKIIKCDEPLSSIIVCEMEGRFSHDPFDQMYKLPKSEDCGPQESKDLIKHLGEKHDEGWGMFYCQDDDDNVITFRLVCDGFRTCNNGKDEQYCPTLTSKELQGYHFCVNPNSLDDFPTRTSIPSEARCNYIKDCPDKSDEEGCDGCSGRQCKDGTCIPAHWIPRQIDECHLYQGINKKVFLNTSYPSSIQCLGLVDLIHEIIFCNKNITFEIYSEAPSNYKNQNRNLNLEWSPKCLYVKGPDGSPTGCHNRHHLKDCKLFQCPEGFLKCPASYCVPVFYFFDGVFDCPFGEDEFTSFNMFQEYFNFFLCWESFIFIDSVHICDGVTQCPYGEDETYCNFTCPPGFKCNGQAVEVGNHSLVSEIKSLNIFDIKTKFLNLSGIDLSNLNEVFIFPNMLEIHASNCNLVDLGELFLSEYENHYLYTANLGYNKLKELNNFGELSNLKNLQFLNLSNNKQLFEIGFYSVLSQKLHTLDLSFTRISSLRLFILENNNSVKFLNLGHTNLVKLGSFKVIKPLRLEYLNLEKTSLNEENMIKILKSVSVNSYLYVDHYKYCCHQISTGGTPKHACHSPPDAFSSCEDLLSDLVKRTLLWLVAVLSLAANLIVIIYRLFYERDVLKKGYGLFVVQLCVSDFVMGAYLLIIALTDVSYRDEYAQHESEWRHSALCHAAGFLSTLSSETSTFFVFLITLDRCLAVRFPFGDHRFTKLGLVLSILSAWICGLILASIPLMYPDWIIYTSNAMCFGLPIIFVPHPGWHFSFGVFVCFNFILFILIALGQIFIFCTISSSHRFQMTNAMSVARRVQDINVAKQLFLVVLSNFLCWFPICVLGLLSLTGYSVSPDAYSWLVIFVMPLNAAVNPMIYTIPFIYSKWQVFKNGERTRTRSPVNETGHVETRL